MVPEGASSDLEVSLLGSLLEEEECGMRISKGQDDFLGMYMLACLQHTTQSVRFGLPLMHAAQQRDMSQGNLGGIDMVADIDSRAM